jgi:cytoskeletal protein CcmA (bactofilin family)
VDELNKVESVTNIAKGTQVTANIQTASNIRVAGIIDGDIKTQKKLILTETGRITGSVIAQEAILEGRFTGELRIKHLITVRASAIIDGFIFSKKITVDENAKVIGILSVGPDVDVLNAKLSKNPQQPEIRKAKEAISNAHGEDTTETDSPSGQDSTPAQTRFIANVLIGVPSDEVDQDKAGKFKTACEDFMNELGFELEIFDEPVFDSFYQKLTYVRKSSDSEQHINELYSKGKESLETALLNKGNTEDANPLQKSADKLVQLFKQFDEFAVILGWIVIVQKMEDDVQSIAVEKLPEQLNTDLKKNPEFVTDPARVYSYIEN